MNRILITILLLLLNVTCKGQNMKQVMTQEQQRERLIQLAKEERSKYQDYSEKPMYYLQINKKACRLIAKVNDIPLGYYFRKDGGETMLLPINDYLFASGEHTFSVDVYPRTNEEVISNEAWVNVKLVYLPEESMSFVPNSQVLEEINLPTDIGAQKLSFYTDSMAFKATVPFDYSHILRDAQLLTDIPDLELKVVERFKEIRQYFVDCDAVGFSQDRHLAHPLAAMSYLSEDDLIRVITRRLDDRFNSDQIDRKVLEIEDYDMVICGYGKFVLLRHKPSLSNIIRITYFDSEEKKKENPKNFWTFTHFVVLHMPKGSDKLEIFY